MRERLEERDHLHAEVLLFEDLGFGLELALRHVEQGAPPVARHFEFQEDGQDGVERQALAGGGAPRQVLLQRQPGRLQALAFGLGQRQRLRAAPVDDAAHHVDGVSVERVHHRLRVRRQVHQTLPVHR